MANFDIGRVNQTITDFKEGARARGFDKMGVPMKVKSHMKWKTADLQPGADIDVYFTKADPDHYFVYVKGEWRIGLNCSGYRYLSGMKPPPQVNKDIKTTDFDKMSTTPTGHKADPGEVGPDNSPSWANVLNIDMYEAKNMVKQIFTEAIREVFAEGIKPAPDTEIRGWLGFPFDKYIVKGSVKVDDHVGENGKKTHNGMTYTWKVLLPIDDPEVLSNLDESKETFEEKVLETISLRLQIPTQPDGEYSSGFGEVEARQTIGGKQFLLIKIETTIGWDL